MNPASSGPLGPSRPGKGAVFAQFVGSVKNRLLFLLKASYKGELAITRPHLPGLPL